MKTLTLTICLICSQISSKLSLTLLLSLASIAQAADQNPPQSSLVEKLHDSYQGVTYFESTFEQEKSVKFLSKPITSTGKLVFSPELGLVWEVKSPVWVKTLINDEGVFKSNSRHNAKKVKDPQIKVVASILTELLSSQLDRVESQFNIKDVVEDVEVGQWSVTLEAKGALIKKAIASISIRGLLSEQGAGSGINSLLILDASGNETKITLSEQLFSHSALTTAQHHAFD